MNQQINLRLPGKLLISAQKYAQKHGFTTIQEFIKETVREKLFEKPEITRDELDLAEKLFMVSEKKSLYGTEKEMFKKLRRK